MTMQKLLTCLEESLQREEAMRLSCEAMIDCLAVIVVNRNAICPGLLASETILTVHQIMSSIKRS